MKMIERLGLVALALSVAGCGSTAAAEKEAEAGAESGSVATEGGPPADPVKPASREPLAYTSLKAEDCELIEENRDEAGYARHRCTGYGGYTLETTESDLRQDLTVIASSRSTLGLTTNVAKGAFNSLGPTAEWRGKEARRPTALIVRFNVADGRDANRPDTSNLVVIELSNSSSCIAAVVPPGPRQNELARDKADSLRGVCL
jgi:hypothetical protein